MNKKLCDVSEIKFCSVSPSRSKCNEVSTKWLVCSNFLPDNKIDYSFTTNDIVPSQELVISKHDIVIKRIIPTYINYIEEIPDGIYAGNNLIIVTPKDNIDPKYLAMILNNRICDLSKESSIGAVMKSITRSDLAALEIPCPNIELQHALGELWYNGIELKKKRIRLAELENIKISYSINKAIKILGGKKNG